MIIILAFITICLNIIFLKKAISKMDDGDKVVNKIQNKSIKEKVYEILLSVSKIFKNIN
jgi:hypothetical protein